MTEVILVVVAIVAAIGYLIWRAFQKPKHGCPDCEISTLRQKQR